MLGTAPQNWSHVNLMKTDRERLNELASPSFRPALRGGVTGGEPPLYPALFSNPLHCPCLGHFAEARRGKTGRCQGQKVSPGDDWAISQPPGDSLR